MAPHNIVYTPNVSSCLFNFTLQGNDISSLGSVEVFVVGRNGKERAYPIFNLPQYLNFQFSTPPPHFSLCTPAGEDIQAIVSAELEEKNEVVVMEVLVTISDCENDGLFFAKYFGRSARLILNSSAAGECVTVTIFRPHYSEIL